MAKKLVNIRLRRDQEGRINADRGALQLTPGGLAPDPPRRGEGNKPQGASLDPKSIAVGFTPRLRISVSDFAGNPLPFTEAGILPSSDQGWSYA